MKMIRTVAVLLCMCGFSLTGCERLHKKSLSAEAEACRAQIAVFRSNISLGDWKIFRDGRKIVEQAIALTNDQERIMLCREFTKEFYRIDISRCTVREAAYMLDEYCLMPEYLAYGLIRAGGSTEEAWRSLVTGLEKYRQLCFSFGDENDMSDGRGREASDRRHVARWGRKSWEGCLLFCRDHTIKSVFGPDNKDTIDRLQARLEKKFGKIEERRSK